MWDACARLPYASADARLLDGFEKWLGWRGKGQPVPGPQWALACALASAVGSALADPVAARLLAPWARREAVPSGDAPGDAFRPLGG